ncbi:fimbria/pilus periplasmic chaperone [Erythrobacter aquimaris]|uniref:Fimbria/pilus periplasmic chaperone n=1 Tax=Qipengyuania aquimaris TaxID=255984 RepID=A0A6I4TGG6_9SPHN|nr:fimbria/pilus periplasmic chaperone [Qipengyuania aquimaris]MXO94806.1 fimbria/pilus periplasmic chaperone [Qipengyuania aquimaris]
MSWLRKMILFMVMIGTWATPLSANLVLDKVIIDFRSGDTTRGDIELLNDGGERLYVAIEPFEILHSGTDREERVALDLSEDADLFVSPRRLILEPGERRQLRIALLGQRPAVERVFRVRVRPVVGQVTSEEDGLKLLVGYDTLVLVRPERTSGSVEIVKDESSITLVNRSNSSFEYFKGRACQINTENCDDLPPNRLHPGERWTINNVDGKSIEYTRSASGRLETLTF